MAGVSPARREAFRILLRMERGSTHADDLLRGRDVSVLAPADRNLATALVLGVLRWQIWLDRQVRTHLTRPNAKLELEALIALRLGAYQLLFLDRIPAHAAIDESVELVKQAGRRFAAGMVNAVLRKLARDPQASETGVATAGAEAALAAHPSWMVERWIAHFGAEAARAICLHGQAQPEPAVRLERAEDETGLARDRIELAPGALLACARRVKAGDVTATEAFRAGSVRLQDEGSQLIAELACIAAPPDQNKTKILDACAAPGGKTLILAQRLPQARIVALEASAKRFAALRERLSILGERVECRHADATALQEEKEFDLALVDAPCSGTGTLGRNPEIRHRLKPEDLARHADRQRAILSNVLRALRPGGRVVYSTCSLEPEENEQVVAAVLENARQISLAAPVEQLGAQGILTQEGGRKIRACLTPEGALRLMPGALHTEGFFVALLATSS